METEKVCVNVAPVELGEMDILVARGMFTTRTDLVRTGIRRVLDEHREVINEVTRDPNPGGDGDLVLAQHGVGFSTTDRAMLEKYRARGERIEIAIVGIARLADDITPDLADEVIGRIRIFGALRCSKEVRDRLADRIVRTL